VTGGGGRLSSRWGIKSCKCTHLHNRNVWSLHARSKWGHHILCIHHAYTLWLGTHLKYAHVIHSSTNERKETSSQAAALLPEVLGTFAALWRHDHKHTHTPAIYMLAMRTSSICCRSTRSTVTIKALTECTSSSCCTLQGQQYACSQHVPAAFWKEAQVVPTLGAVHVQNVGLRAACFHLPPRH